MTILCATDSSKPAADAVDVAADIARKRGESRLLWHAVEPQAGDPVSLGTCSTVIGWPEEELVERRRMPCARQRAHPLMTDGRSPREMADRRRQLRPTSCC